MSLTNDDLTKLANLVNSANNSLRTELKDYIDEKVAILPSKDDFFDRTDQILGNQVKDKEEIDLVSARVSDHEQRLQALESGKDS